MGAATVVMVDGGGANITSLRCALERLGITPSLTTDADAIRSASHVILPGVGAAADGMRRLEASGLTELLPELEQPVLGICLGMQLLADSSAENDTKCLGVFPAAAARLENSPGYAVPNMGWCRVAKKNGEHPLLRNIEDGAWFYFVHSYALPDDELAIGIASHTNPFAAAISHKNFHATQFHPERSAAAGAQLLRNFLDLH